MYFRDKDVVLLPTELGGEEVTGNVAALLALKNQDVSEKDPGWFLSHPMLYYVFSF